MPEFVAEPGRLDRVAAERLGLARAEVQRAIAAGRVTVDGERRPKSHALAGGERVSVDLGGLGDLQGEAPAVPVVFADEWLAVVDKPAGVPTHPTASHRQGTLVNRLLGMGMRLAPGGAPDRPGIVHRLDAGTSGLIVVAKDPVAQEALSAMFRRHAVDRRYLALVRGAVEHDRFAVEAPLARAGARIVVRLETGRASVTRLEVRERFDDATLLEAAPQTGRTHQIRVHLSAVGHPILGDRRYGGGGDVATRLRLERPFLHSWRVAFEHPVTGQHVALEAPLPDDLSAALDRVRAGH